MLIKLLHVLRHSTLDFESLPFDNIPGNVWRQSPKRLATLPRIDEDISWNAWRHSPENNSYIVPRSGMASVFHMFQKASYLFIFSWFFSIIIMFFHSFFQFSTCFTSILLKTIITVYFINCSSSFYVILFLFLLFLWRGLFM